MRIAKPYDACMMRMSFEKRRRLECLDSEALAHHQLGKLNWLLESILPQNQFYKEMLGGIELPLKSLDELSRYSFTFKDELIGNSETGDVAANLTFPIDNYVRFHRTSGTRGRPLVLLDTEDDWQWWIECWQFVLDVAEIDETDRVMMAFSFGPFIGFWSANDAVVARGSLVIPGGGLSTLARLELVRTAKVTALLCTPSYALHMAEIAAENQIDIRSSSVGKIVVAGEPGGSVASIRQRIEEAWNARVVDHSGATEVGAWGYANPDGTGLYVNESEFIAEFLSVESGETAGEGELSELVLTTLGRVGCPVIRYRTGDLVRPTWNSEGPCRFVLLEGGILSRSDDMMVIRGVNVFPSSVEQILRSFPEVVEYRITVQKEGEMDALLIEIEDHLNDSERVAKEFQLRLGLKVQVTTVPTATLPRFEGKGKRFVDKR